MWKKLMEERNGCSSNNIVSHKKKKVRKKKVWKQNYTVLFQQCWNIVLQFDFTKWNCEKYKKSLKRP